MKEVKYIIIFLTFMFASAVNGQRKVVCYWSADLDANQINPNICTHIIYSFLGLDSQGRITYLWRSEAQALGLISSLVDLKSRNPNLKVLAAVGGYNEALIPIWSSVAANAVTRVDFANNILVFIRKNRLDGIDIDWEYPNFAQDKPQDKNNFILLLQQIKQTIGSSYSLSVAIGAGEWRSSLSYDIPRIFATVDFVNLMSYDLHGGWESRTGIHAALYRSNLDNSPANVHESVQFVLKQGVDKNKLILGIPAYGNAFTLLNSANNGVGAAASGAGSHMYNEICRNINSGAYTSRWEDTQKVPYAFSGTFWIGYDNVRSVTEKANYLIAQQLGGAMFWSLDSDDARGSCGSGNFPLINSVYKIVNNGNIPAPQPQPNPVTPSPKPGSFTCPGNGFYKDPTNCSKFYQCWANVAYPFSCQSGLYFNEAGAYCDWPYNVKC